MKDNYSIYPNIPYGEEYYTRTTHFPQLAQLFGLDFSQIKSSLPIRIGDQNLLLHSEPFGVPVWLRRNDRRYNSPEKLTLNFPFFFFFRVDYYVEKFKALVLVILQFLCEIWIACVDYEVVVYRMQVISSFSWNSGKKKPRGKCIICFKYSGNCCNETD